ncbi:MAG: STAS domain-containing protein [Deltaproteobacteria bacterium]|nr:STAS domain-containing protein [Deltaproteobacteria bacterium]MBZ0220625.1 STAS domain-containing protein [Deltaproteobacteria bacterium]
MPVRIEKDGENGSISVEGEMNIYHAQELKDGLMRAMDGEDSVSLDLSRVSEMDSSGLQLVLLAWREADRKGAPFRLIGASTPVDDVLSLFDLKKLFCEDRETV